MNAAIAREQRERHALVEAVAWTVRDRRVLRAMGRVPRRRFVPADLQHEAYDDVALPIGEGQTISQPTVVGLMTEALALSTGREHVLEIGTGSGYQAAVLSELAHDVVTVEIVDTLRERAASRLRALGADNVHVVAAGGTPGWPDGAPYDAIVVTAAAPRVPPSLVEQLKVGGRLVLPVGSLWAQRLLVVTRTRLGTEERSLGACRFVPLAGPEGFIAAPARPAPARVARAEGEAMLPALRAQLRHGSTGEVAAAAHVLARAAVTLPFDALDHLREAVDAEADPARRGALTRDYLALLGPVEAPGAIADLLARDDPARRDAALDAAVALGPTALAALTPLADAADRDTRWFAVEALRRIDGARAIPVLARRLEDDDFAVRWTAADGLIAAGHAAFRPVLHALIGRPASLPFHHAARRVIEHTAPPGADREGRVSALLDALRWGTTVFESGGLALELLGSLGRDEAEP